LGNPGRDYETTRHNAGFILADALASRWQFPPFRRPWRWRARVSTGSLGDQQVILVKPQTYMNRSGAALGPLLDQDGFEPSRDLLILVDEIALALGTFRIRRGGSDNGHNGLKSVAGRLASEEYPRLRIGVGPRPPDERQADYLLSPFTDEQMAVVESLLPSMMEAVECWAREGIETAMNRFNRRGTQSD
jgi:peptidyl-tRNA hydrolase, PTH1 family